MDEILQECIEFVETYHRLKSRVDVARKAWETLTTTDSLKAVGDTVSDFTIFKSNMPRAIELMDKLITAVEKQEDCLKSDRN